MFFYNRGDKIFKNKISISVLCILVIVVTSTCGCFEEGEKDTKSSNGIQWKDYENAISSANTSGKPIMVDFYADWCGPCREMDKETYTNEKVIELSSDFECAKVDVDEQPDLGNNYDIEYLPTTVFLSPNGDELNRLVGYVDADTLHQEMIDAKNMI